MERIILIGFTATGKSTVAVRLAQRLGWEFVDTDQEVVRRSGKSLHQIFHGEGEASFRRYEAAVLNDASRRRGIVVAAGAGSPLVERARRLMQRSFFVVCLEARPETLYQRLLRDKETGSNPIAELLTKGNDPIGHIACLKQYRQPYYGIAHWTVHTDCLTPDEVVEEIVHGWSYFRRRGRGQRCPISRSGLRYPLGDARESDAPYVPNNAGVQCVAGR